MTTKAAIGLVAGLGILAFVAGFLTAMSNDQQNLGTGAYNALPTWFGNGLSAGSSEQFSVDADGDTVAKSLTLTNSSATSTLIAGCVQTNATSSATPVKLLFGTVATTTGNGFVLWQYGTCP
jgi:hypothetical protein